MVAPQTNLKRLAPFRITIGRTVGSSKDRTPPYYVTFENGDDASEVERVRGSTKKSAPQLGEPMPKSHAQLNREIAEVLNKRHFKLVPQPAMSGRAGIYH
jgi:hypothetical protein